MLTAKPADLFDVTVDDPLTKALVQVDLTKRERDVLDCLLRGLTRKKAAIELRLQPGTVDIYRSRLYTRLHVHNRSSLRRRVTFLDFSSL